MARTETDTVPTRYLGERSAPKPGPFPARPQPAPPKPASGYSPFALDAEPRNFGLTTSSMRVKGGSIVVRHGRRGAGDTATILLHGAAGSWTTWTPLLQAADASQSPLADLIIPDLPGWGDSPLPDDRSSLSVESMAALVADTARALGYTRWNVIGHSMGGFIALELAARETQSTISVGLVSATSYSIQASARNPIRNFALLPAFTLLLATMRLLRLAGPVGSSLVQAVARRGLLRTLVSPLFSEPRNIHATVVRALGIEVRPHGFVLAAERAGLYDSAAHWAKIGCPVRAVHGNHDVFVTPADDERLRAAVPQCVISTISGAGHFGQVERPFDVLQGLELRNFAPGGVAAAPHTMTGTPPHTS